MANVTINSLTEVAYSALDGADWLVVDDGTTTRKLAALSAAIKTITTLGSAGAEVVKTISGGTLSQRDIVGGEGVAVTESATALTFAVDIPNTTLLDAAAAVDDELLIWDISGTPALKSITVANLLSTSLASYLTTVNLATNVSGILPIANGGTGKSSLTGKGILTTDATGANVAPTVLDADAELVVGTTSGPQMKTLTAGASITVTQDNSANTLTIGFTKGNYVETSDTPTFGNATMAEATVDKIMTSGTKAVTQGTSGTPDLTTSVTCNGSAGVITLASGSIAATTVHSFVLENTEITSSSVIMLTLLNPTTADEDNVHLSLQSVVSSRATINIANNTSTIATAQVRKIHFMVMN
tara:strand:+ start:15617 stop:16687 length:1071 start_codon:yes stop_codon:yes gene_type:complete